MNIINLESQFQGKYLFKYSQKTIYTIYNIEQNFNDQAYSLTLEA